MDLSICNDNVSSSVHCIDTHRLWTENATWISLLAHPSAVFQPQSMCVCICVFICMLMQPMNDWKCIEASAKYSGWIWIVASRNAFKSTAQNTQNTTQIPAKHTWYRDLSKHIHKFRGAKLPFCLCLFSNKWPNQCLSSFSLQRNRSVFEMYGCYFFVFFFDYFSGGFYFCIPRIYLE